MSSWRSEQNNTADFLDLLYKDEVDEDQQMSEMDSEDEPEAPPYSPLSSPHPPHEERDRSRSPIRPHESPESLGVVLRIYDENGRALDDTEYDTFLTPDAHVLFEGPEVEVTDERNVRERRRNERRGGQTGLRDMRGRGRSAPHQGHRMGYQWEVGHPLNEIWTTDDDVPLELVRLARDVVRRRETRVKDANSVERIEGERNRTVRGNDSESENDNEFFDASDAPNGLPGLEVQDLSFDWKPMDSFQGEEERFLPKFTGSVQTHNSAYGAFRSYWDDDILDRIVTETNRYATKIASVDFQSVWYPTNIDEILCLFAFWMMLGIVRMPTITSCFSADPLLKTEVFRRIFTRKRYEHLTRTLHFVNSEPINDINSCNTGAARSLDRLYSVRPIITHLNSKFQSNYVLGKDICIDESLTLWKGRLDFKQYIPNKASRFGIKTIELCESVTGYLWSFIVYSGKNAALDMEQAPDELKSATLVKKLIGPLLNKGYRLFMDNWYNSPLLARFLKLNGTDCVGTLRSHRRDVPVIINKAPLKRGEIVARHSGDVTVLSWQDVKRVTMISTCHGSSTALPRVASRPPPRPIPYKPQVVLEYNRSMGGVDLKDQMLQPYLLERKRCAKWYMKLFKRLLNVSILNARILLQSSANRHLDHLAFRLQLVDSILANHLSHCPRSRMNNSLYRSFVRKNISHWPATLDSPEDSAANKRSFRKRCVVCLREGRKSQRTSFSCEACGVPLCIKNCFKSYHTQSQSCEISVSNYTNDIHE